MTAVNDGAYHCLAGVGNVNTTQSFTDGTASTLHTGSSFNQTGTTATNVGADYTNASLMAGNIAYAAMWSTSLANSDITTICGVTAFMVIPELRPLRRPEWAYGATEERMIFLKRKLS